MTVYQDVELSSPHRTTLTARIVPVWLWLLLGIFKPRFCLAPLFIPDNDANAYTDHVVSSNTLLLWVGVAKYSAQSRAGTKSAF